MRKFYLAIIPGLLAFESPSAIASPLPATYIQGSVYANPDPCCARTNGTNISQSNSGAYASNTLNLSTAPSVSATSQARLIDPTAQGVVASVGRADVSLFYYFTINAPDSMVVPLFVKASGFTSVGSTEDFHGGNGADAYFNVSDFTKQSLTGHIQSNQEDSSDKSFNFNGYYDFQTNVPIQVQMTVQTGAGVTDLLDSPPDAGLRSAFASIDPYFALDPSDTGLSLSFSAGINNVLVSTVPLPASAPMFGAAILALGAIGYGRRRKQADAAM